MRVSIWTVLVLLVVSCLAASEPPPTDRSTSVTIYLVRHAEKAAGGEDPSLSPEGQERARALARVVADAGISAIYTSQSARTRNTAQPLADRLKLAVTVVPIERGELDAQLRSFSRRVLAEHAGDSVLVVGHSNTVPVLIEALGAENAPRLTNRDYDDLFVVVVNGSSVARLLHLHYGASSP